MTAHSCDAPLRVLLIALVTVTGLMLPLLPFLAPAPAAAVTVDGRMIDFGGWTLGTRQLDSGQYVYCIEPGAWTPVQSQTAPVVVDVLRGYSIWSDNATGWLGTVSSGPVSGEPLRRINYLLSIYGATEDANTAAALQLAIWLLRDSPGEVEWLNHHIAWISSHGGSTHVQRAYAFAAEARATARPAAAPTLSAITLHTGETFGHGTARYPAGTTELRIEGGIFSNGAQTIDIHGGLAGEVTWATNLHPVGWQRHHAVSIAGSWQTSSSGWPAQVEIFPSAIPREQTLSWAVGPVAQRFSGELTPGHTVIDTQFSPVLSSRVDQRWISIDAGPFNDTVTVESGKGGVPWPSRTGAAGEEFAPLELRGVVYGPFNTPQQPAAAAPVGAPVAGTASVRADRGPGEYVASTREVPDESGYYYWVWTVREEEQESAVRDAGLLPAEYVFADAFGLAHEGHVVPTRLRWSTELAERELTLGRLMIVDRVTAHVRDGAWLRDAHGARIPARLRLSVYASETEPVQRTGVPAGAEEIARGFVDVAQPLRSVTSDPIWLPTTTRGWVTVRVCLLAEDQEETVRGAIEEWCDDYGVPSETARIKEPPALAETGSGEVSGVLVGSSALLVAGGGVMLVHLARRRHQKR